MKEEIKELFKKSGNSRLTFVPSIRIFQNQNPTWIDGLYKIKENVYAAVSSRNDKANRSLDSMTEAELKCLHGRMSQMFQQK